MACVMNSFAAVTAFTSDSPRASRAVIAAEYVQPVPCVETPRTNGADNISSVLPSKKTSTASRAPRRCPPLTSAAQPNRPCNTRAAARNPSSSRTDKPVSNSASSRFGVTSAASGSNSRWRRFTAADCSSRAPLVAIITGSTTSGGARRARKNSVTTPINGDENSIPVLHAAGGSSSNTASICFRNMSGDDAWMPRTPRGFCAVRQVIAQTPCTPSAANVFKSA